MHTGIAGRVAVVTGAGGNLCSEMAKGLAAEGAKVALIGRTLEKLDAVREVIEKAGGTAVSVPADVTVAEEVRAAGEAVMKALGPCDILVNGAGGNRRDAITTLNEFAPEELAGDPGEVRGFFNLDPDAFSHVVLLNTTGTMIPCQVFGRQMAENGGGAIVNIASMNSYTPLTRNAAYAAGKAGVENFTRWLAAYLAPANIRVNGIAPGFFPKQGGRGGPQVKPDGSPTERGELTLANTPMKRFGLARDLVGATLWLASDEAAGFVTGVTIPVDGGFVANSPV
jgi:NAD(P)-dependent dehydrogenase (short-subunit alcohol dehydrogenase family)